MPACKLVWYEGIKDGQKNLPAPELMHGEKPSDSGLLLVGDKGVLFSPNDYGASFKLLPVANFEGFKKPEPSLPRLGGGNDESQKKEWFAACKGGPAAMSNFEYAGLLTEAMLLGNVAVRAGKAIQWDGPNMKIPNARRPNSTCTANTARAGRCDAEIVLTDATRELFSPTIGPNPR